MNSRKTILKLALALTVIGLLFPSSLLAQTATVSGNLQNLGATAITSSNTYVEFTLRNYGSTLPRVSGTAVVVSKRQRFNPDGSGDLSGSIYRNDNITPDNTFYRVCVFDNGRRFRCNDYSITSSTFDLSSASPLTSAPSLPIASVVLTNPGGGALQTIAGPLGIDGQAAATVQLIVEGATSQSANLQNWRDSTETVLSSVDSSGNFGILTASPSSPLEVVGDVEFGTLFKWDNALGRMGVGTASPSVDLHVLGAGITLDNPLDGDAALKIDSGATTGNGSCVELEDQGIIIWTFCKDAANDLALTNVGTGVEVFDFKAAGNLSIRVGAQSGSLRVRDAGGLDMMTIADAGSVGDVTITGDLTVDGVMQSAVDDEVLVSNGTTMENKAVPSCSNTTTSKLLYNTSTNTFTCGTDQTVGGGLDDFSTALLVDEFMSTGTTTINGQLGWEFFDVAGSGSISTSTATVFNNPGLLGFSSGGTSGNQSGLVLRSSNVVGAVGVLGLNAGWDSTFIIKTGSTVANVEYTIGFINQLIASPDQIIVRFIAGTDTNWTYETCQTTCTTSGASGIPPVANTLYRFRIRSTSSGNILFSVDGGSETTLSTDITTLARSPFISVKTLTSAVRDISADLFIYKATVSR